MQKSEKQILNMCYHGGAAGADAEWSKAALAAGHGSVATVFKGHKVKFPCDVMEMTLAQMDEVRGATAEVNAVLGRTFPTHNDYVDKLLLRNVWIGRNVASMYAVGWLSSGAIQGGTAWACAAYLAMGLDDLWFYDQGSQEWSRRGASGVVVEPPPRPSGVWGAAGSRALHASGVNAIRSLFEPPT